MNNNPVYWKGQNHHGGFMTVAQPAGSRDGWSQYEKENSMKSTVDYSVLWTGDEDAYSTIDTQVDYLRAAHQASLGGAPHYQLPGLDVAVWLDSATGLAQDRFLYAHVKNGKIATMDGYRLHVYHSPETIPDGVYWLVDDKIIKYDKPEFQVPDWEAVIPTQQGQELHRMDATMHTVPDGDIKYLEWLEPFKYRLQLSYWQDAVLLGGERVVWAEASTKSCLVRFDGGMAVIMPMHPDF